MGRPLWPATTAAPSAGACHPNGQHVPVQQAHQHSQVGQVLLQQRHPVPRELLPGGQIQRPGPQHLPQIPVAQRSVRDGDEVQHTGEVQRLKKLLFCTKPDNRPTGWPGEADSYELTSSPLSAITLPDAARTKAAIPLNALFYSFCHPVVQNTEIPDVIRGGGYICWFDPFVVWLTTGAFIYYDFQFDVVGINAVCFDEVDLKEATTSTLCLGDSSPLPLSAIQPLREYNRWQGGGGS